MLILDGGEAKKKWQYLKGQYGREKRKRKKPTGSEGGDVKPWVYKDAMSFLDGIPDENDARYTTNN
jgi:hypothetical protein